MSEADILLIRNSYGRSDLVILGGGIRPLENNQQAASREIKEELGCDLAHLTRVSPILAPSTVSAIDLPIVLAVSWSNPAHDRSNPREVRI